MKLISWAGGLALSGFFYSIFVIALSISQWPSIENPHLNLLLGNKLPEASQTLVYKIIKTKGHTAAKDSPPFTLQPGGYVVKESKRHLDIANMVNGHTLIFEAGSPIEKIKEISTQYFEILAEYQANEERDAKRRLLVTLLIPIITLAIFAWAGNKLWRAIRTLH